MEQLDKAREKGVKAVKAKLQKKGGMEARRKVLSKQKRDTLTKKSKIQKGVYAGSIQSLDNMRSKHVKDVQGLEDLMVTDPQHWIVREYDHYTNQIKAYKHDAAKYDRLKRAEHVADKARGRELKKRKTK
jgi:hypothetical protein